MTTPKTNRTVKPKGKSLSARLLSAQRGLPAVGKGSRNEYANYDYASAEDVMKSARVALHDNDLFVVCVSRKYVHLPDRGSVVQSMFELHSPESDEVKVVGPIEVPVLERKGTTIEKAVLAVQTTSQSYALRDILQIPRLDGNEVDSLPEQAAAPNVSVKKKSRIQAEKDS